MLYTCHTCAGTKKIRQLGMMLADCPICEGTGKLTAEQVAATRIAAQPEPIQLPDDFYQKQRDETAARLKNANVAHLNRPIEIKSSQQAPSLDLHGNPIAPGIPPSGGLQQKTVAPVMDARATAAAAHFENEVKVGAVDASMASIPVNAPIVAPPSQQAAPAPIAKTGGKK